MKLSNKKSVSPAFAVVLIVAVTIAAGVSVYVIVNNNFSDKTSVTVTTSPIIYDHNNDGMIDAIKISIKNNGPDMNASYVAFIDSDGTYQWFIGEQEETVLIKDQEISILLFTNSTSDQLNPTSTVTILFGESVSNYGQTTVELPDNPTVPDPVTVTVTAGGKSVSGTQISFTTPAGVPASVPPTSTDSNGKASFYLLPNKYIAKTSDGKTSETFDSLYTKSVSISGTSQTVSVLVLDTSGSPLSGTSVYTTDTSQNDLGGSAITNSSGYADFTLSTGKYLFRANYLGQNYWSSQLDVPSNTKTLTIQISSGTLNGSVYFGDVKVEKTLYLRLYTANNVSLNYHYSTNASGYFSFTRGVVAGLYRLRLTFQGKYYWSQVLSTSTPNLKANFGGGYLTVNITVGNEPIRNRVFTRLYNSNNQSMWLYSYTNATGGVSYGAVPRGNYRIRLDWLRMYTYSTAFKHTGKALTVNYNGGPMIYQIRLNDSAIRNRVLVRLFTASGLYTYLYAYTNSTGYVNFGNVLAANYKFRIDWLRMYNFTSTFYHDGVSPKVVDIEGYSLTVKITVGGEPIRERVLIRLFTSTKLYTYLYAYTNATGYVNFGSILAGHFRLRVDWLRQYVYSSVFTHNNASAKTLNFAGGQLVVKINIAGEPIRDRVLTRLFYSSGSTNLYSYYYAYTNASGYVNFGAILNGTYKLRIDWLRQYTFTSQIDHQDNTPKTVNMNGGRLLVHLTTEGYDLPNRALTRLFVNSTSLYTYLYAYTNATGWVDYGTILEGTYKLRIDWLRLYTFTGAFTHANSTPKALDLHGGKLVVKVNIGGEPVTRRTLVRLFTNNLLYTYKYAYTNSTGYADFGPILAGNFTLRYDTLRQYVYSTYFFHNNSMVQSVNHAGTVRLTIHVLDGANSNAPLAQNQLIRLFLDTGTYTYLYAYTNSSGYVTFTSILNNTYKIRWDNPNPDIYSSIFNVNDTTSATIEIVLSSSGGLINTSLPFANVATNDTVWRKEDEL